MIYLIYKDAGVINVRREGTKNYYYLDPDIHVHQSTEDSGSSKDKRLLCDRPVYRCGNVSCIPERKIHDDVYNCADNNDRRDCPDRQRYIDT